MLDLAIATDFTGGRETTIETNTGRTMSVLNWPQDCEVQLVSFDALGKVAHVVLADELATDIGRALRMLKELGAVRSGSPDWYRRLAACADAALD